ncbi:Tuftelin-interacting protein 11 [Grifola frondosa]|uniref:Tuftelin-interacting protein 11 n=1 Tax=Grifola frondosa TaxID=5627 RepID=A0A1C7MA94_GRIFR|nr:Tuftelin-interacting protein 11 [Grifola frondosa]
MFSSDDEGEDDEKRMQGRRIGPRLLLSFRERRLTGKDMDANEAMKGESGTRMNEYEVGEKRTRMAPGARGEESSPEPSKPSSPRVREEEEEERQATLWNRFRQEVPQAGIGQIIDATGAIPREVASLADISLASWTPTADATRLPEVRHNLRLITETCKGDLDGLAREARALEERKKWIRDEDVRLRKRVQEEAELIISRLQQVHLVVDEISSQAREMASVYEASLEPFSANFDKLLGQFPKEFDRYRLDEVIVAAIAPVVRRLLAQWQPLEDPTLFTPIFRMWRRALKMTAEDKIENQVQVYGSGTIVSTSASVEKPMTPYESLLWNSWLPRVRSSLNNDWSPDFPQPAVRLYEAWSSFLPPFIRDNFFDQLILPKVHKAVEDWRPRKSKVSLQALVFPWLPHIGLRLEDVLGDARRKVKSVLRAWTVTEGVPKDLQAWQDVFDAGDWDAMLLKYVVPKLGIFSDRDHVQLLEAEFFPKWLDILHIWLIQPHPSFEEVSRWYSFWKGTFSENVQSMPGVAQGFTRGLQLMNKAIELGPDAATRLPRPDHLTYLSPPLTPGAKPSVPKTHPVRTQEITFRSIVEDYASSHNLLLMPIGRVHELSRMPLFRVSLTADGKGGLLVYIQDDAVWASDGEEYRAISLEDMVSRATKDSHM